MESNVLGAIVTPAAARPPACPGLDEWRRALGQDAHSAAADSRFVAPDADDYRLSVGSPAAGLGTPLADADQDFAGTPRRKPPDAGAHERQEP